MTDESSIEHRPAGHIVLSLAGEYDLARQGELDRALAAIPSLPVVVLDLSDVSYLDSSALACFVRLKNSMRESGTVVLVGPNKNIRRVLEVTKFDRLFEIYDSVEEALAE